jgi:hypothetical protein
MNAFGPSFPPFSIPPTVYLQQTFRDEKPSGTNGGNAPNTNYNTRELNAGVPALGGGGISTIIAGMSLDTSTYEFVVPAGTFYITASAPAGYALGHKARLFNVTDNAVELLGTSEYTNQSAIDVSRSFLTGLVILTAPTTYRIEHRIGDTGGNTWDYGVNAGTGDVEVYTTITLVKLG